MSLYGKGILKQRSGEHLKEHLPPLQRFMNVSHPATGLSLFIKKKLRLFYISASSLADTRRRTECQKYLMI
jgi:hypothetical protein